MPLKENLDHAIGTELPQRTIPSCLVYWPSCCQTAANKKQQKPIDKEKKGVSMATNREQGRGRKKEHHFIYHAVPEKDC